jgi:type VII secretion protein EccB
VPLNLSNRDQNSGYLFYNRRLRAAITRFSVRMKHDDRKQQAALALSVVFVILGCGWMALLHFIKPAGLVGAAAIVGNRDTGAVYARIDGRLYPALNLTSARLAVGSPGSPAWVKAAQIEKLPAGPIIGIAGIPDDLAPVDNPESVWTVCDTAPVRPSTAQPVVTAIAGRLDDSGRAEPLGPGRAVLAGYRGATYVIADGRRSRIDPASRAITGNLGLDLTRTRPVELSRALFDALPAAEPLVVPVIPAAGTPSRRLPGSVVGRVLQTRDAAGEISGFYVLLDSGVQRITPFVADLLRAGGGAVPAGVQVVSPATLAGIPEVAELPLDFYPRDELDFVDTDAQPVTCVSWRKQSTDRQAAVTVLTGRGLPTQPSLEARVVPLVTGGPARNPAAADQVLVLPGAANLVVATSGAAASDSRESLFWVSAQGVRFGISEDPETLSALGLDPGRAVQAPWPILRTFAAGPAISRAGALLARDAIDPAGPAEAVPGAPAPGGLR